MHVYLKFVGTIAWLNERERAVNSAAPSGDSLWEKKRRFEDHGSEMAEQKLRLFRQRTSSRRDGLNRPGKCRLFLTHLRDYVRARFRMQRIIMPSLIFLEEKLSFEKRSRFIQVTILRANWVKQGLVTLESGVSSKLSLRYFVRKRSFGYKSKQDNRFVEKRLFISVASRNLVMYVTVSSP